MRVQLKHLGFGYQGAERGYKHHYIFFAASGLAGELEDDDFARDGVYELPDDMFQLDSGWVHWECDGCGLTFWQRSRPGGSVTCPMCDAKATVPEDAYIGEYEGDDGT